MITGNFIFIYEDGTVWHRQLVSEEDMKEADYGSLEIIDIGRPTHPRTYYQGEWTLVSAGSPAL